jgi:hypothetical protein
MRLASARLFAARALMGLVDRLVGPPELVPQPSPVAEPSAVPTVPCPVSDDGAPAAHECAACAVSIAVIGDAFSSSAYDTESAPYALRSLSLLGFGTTLPQCPFHISRIP